MNHTNGRSHHGGIAETFAPRAMALDPFVHAQITCVESKGERLESWRLELGVAVAEAHRHAETRARVLLARRLDLQGNTLRSFFCYRIIRAS